MGGFLPIWPSLHLGWATTLPPIQKNSSASLDMEALCQSFGELMMDGLGGFRAGLEASLILAEETLAPDGEPTGEDNKPRDWKPVFVGDEGLPRGPGADNGVMAGSKFISESHVQVGPRSHHMNPPSSSFCCVQDVFQVSSSEGDQGVVSVIFPFSPAAVMTLKSVICEFVSTYFLPSTKRNTAEHVTCVSH